MFIVFLVVLEFFGEKREFDPFFLAADFGRCLCESLCPPHSMIGQLINSGPNWVKVENIGPKYPWLGQHPMDWTKKKWTKKTKQIKICIIRKTKIKKNNNQNQKK